MADEGPRLMQPEQVPDFVDKVINSGYDICAIGHDSYVWVTWKKWKRRNMSWIALPRLMVIVIF
ncbi:hypothetical protein [Phyllobacterium sp. SB3]|uniref:hypothetical protein n=1 Tax=Phyllobacterium sp. SB3 TaxID=3156073 RepID=UPI0032AF0C6E